MARTAEERAAANRNWYSAVSWYIHLGGDDELRRVNEWLRERPSRELWRRWETLVDAQKGVTLALHEMMGPLSDEDLARARGAAK